MQSHGEGKYVKTMKDVEAATPAQLKRMTPPQVDELFAAVWEKRYELGTSLIKMWDSLHRAAGDKEIRYSWNMTASEAEKEAQRRAKQEPHGDAAKVLARMNQYRREIADLDHGPLQKLDDEYDRRGGWNRSYLVTDGHAHRSMNCSTCNNGEMPTRFQWMIDYSGKSEEEIVEAAGHRACTVCYPSAPVAKGQSGPISTMLTSEEEEREAAREKLRDRKAEIAAAKAAKAITAPDGGPLTVHSWTKKAHQKQTRNGIVDVPEQEFFDTLKTLHAARGWLTDQFDSWRGESGTHRDLNKVADAVALKENKTRETVIEEAKTRAKKRK